MGWSFMIIFTVIHIASRNVQFDALALDLIMLYVYLLHVLMQLCLLDNVECLQLLAEKLHLQYSENYVYQGQAKLI